jgi:hypothetical protein|tara:strand:- start:9118 stop:9903 length:786 start_codon:yes stop_codon:yes gene_type:complete
MSEEQKTVSEAGASVKKASELTDDQIIKQLLENAPPVEEVSVELPSKNKFYQLEDPSKPITIRAMTFSDEKAMMSNKNVNIDILNVLLSRCVSNIKIEDLLQFDKLYLTVKLRELSYGDEYTAVIPCPGCRRDNRITFEMSKLNTNFVEDDLTNPQEITLPVLNKKIKVRFPRVKDESYFSNAEHAVSNLWRFVEEIDGHTSSTVISKVIKKLPLKDAHALLQALSSNKYGIDTQVRFLCTFCNHNEIIDMPVTTDFFTES